MKNFRLNRIFNEKSGRFLGVALEEAFFADRDMLSALDGVRSILSEGVDALQVTESQVLMVQAAPGIVRRPIILEVEDFEHPTKGPRMDLLELALRLDVACLVVKLNTVSRVSSAVFPESGSIRRFKDACDRFGMPVMIEVPAFPEGSLRMVERNLLLVQHAVELGADVIRTNIPLGLERYSRLIEAAEGIPVVASANEVAPPGAIVRWAETLIAQGVSGVVLDSEIIASPRATSLMRSMLEVVHCQEDLSGEGKPHSAPPVGAGKRRAPAESRRASVSNIRPN
jgi:DhnA family fructose-bisphosphate aldolase class Ia